MATHSSILAWEISWTEEPGGLQSMGVTKSPTQLSTHLFAFFWSWLINSLTRSPRFTIHLLHNSPLILEQEELELPGPITFMQFFLDK